MGLSCGCQSWVRHPGGVWGVLRASWSPPAPEQRKAGQGAEPLQNSPRERCYVIWIKCIWSWKRTLRGVGWGGPSRLTPSFYKWEEVRPRERWSHSQLVATGWGQGFFFRNALPSLYVWKNLTLNKPEIWAIHAEPTNPKYHLSFKLNWKAQAQFWGHIFRIHSLRLAEDLIVLTNSELQD